MKDMSDRYRITVNLNLRPAAVALLEDLAKARRQGEHEHPRLAARSV